MAHDVFISHSNDDKPAADRIVHALEGAGLSCWVAPRDVQPGADWQESIMDAIAAAKAMVLLFTAHTNESEHVRKEVAAAFDGGLPVIPFRTEPVTPEGALKYRLIDVHWLDAFPPPMERHLQQLVVVLQRLKDGKDAPPQPHPRQKPIPVPMPTDRKIALGLGVVLALVLVWVGFRAFGHHDDDPPAPVSAYVPPPPVAPPPPAQIPAGAPSLPGPGPELVRYYETELVADGPPLTLDGAQVITTETMHMLLQRRAENAVQFNLVDARGCHNGMQSLPGATCLGVNNVDSLQSHYPLDSNVVIFCLDGSCPESYKLASAAVSVGFQHVAWYRGGVNAWRAAGYPTPSFGDN